jgi:hypothetical protein
MKQVRDEAIEQMDMTMQGKMKSADAKDLAKRFKTLGKEERAFVNTLIPKIVDITLHHLLWTLEQDEKISVIVETDGTTSKRIQDISDGLTGELHGDSGWFAKFSKQRR